MEAQGKEKWLSTTRGVHEFYLGFMAISAIILLAAVQWYAIPKLEELFTFALTDSSLVLAVVAIIYSIYSNASVEDAVSSLTTAMVSIPEATVKIEQSAATLGKDVHRLTEITDGHAELCWQIPPACASQSIRQQLHG